MEFTRVLVTVTQVHISSTIQLTDYPGNLRKLLFAIPLRAAFSIYFHL